LLLGTSGTSWATQDSQEYWWCIPGDLTRAGRRLLRHTSTLYLRQPQIVTFLDQHPMKKTVPGTTLDTATVPVVPGRAETITMDVRELPHAAATPDPPPGEAERTGASVQ
jgi:hypothetical protein